MHRIRGASDKGVHRIRGCIEYGVASDKGVHRIRGRMR